MVLWKSFVKGGRIPVSKWLEFYFIGHEKDLEEGIEVSSWFETIVSVFHLIEVKAFICSSC